MKKYKSLIYRMWKISASKIGLSAFVYILLCSFMFLPFVFEIMDEEQGDLARAFEEIMNGGQTFSLEEAFDNFFFLLIPIFVGAGLLFASGIIASDLKVGWNRYAVTLPVAAGENSRAYMMLHFLFFVGFEIITFVYGSLIGKLIHVSFFCGTAMNLFAVLMAVAFIGDTVKNLFCVLFWRHKNVEQIGPTLGFIFGLVVFLGFIAVGSKAMIDVRKVLVFGGSIRGFALSACALVVSFIIAYLLMKKMYERRLP